MAPKSRESTVILDSTFVIEPGETVVVGTSRLQGSDNAPVAVLTALPPARQPLLAEVSGVDQGANVRLTVSEAHPWAALSLPSDAAKMHTIVPL